MADPYVPSGVPSIFEALRRDATHSRDIEAALRSLRDGCAREEIPFAAIGALAMRLHGYDRFTEDIDIVTTPEGLVRIHERFVGRGMVPRGPGLRKKLRDTVHKVNLDVIQAGARAGSKASPIVFPSPETTAFALESEGVLYATLPTLLTLKLAAGLWAIRPTDHADVLRLIQANRLSEEYAERLPDPVRAKFLELVTAARMEQDIE